VVGYPLCPGKVPTLSPATAFFHGVSAVANSIAEKNYNLDALANIPLELREPPLWLQYYLTTDPKKPDKKPTKHPCVKYRTQADHKANLRSLDHLLGRPKQAGFQRLVLKGEGFIFIDLDGVRDSDSGEIVPWAQAIVDSFDTYCEISASGKGLHLVCRGVLDEDFHIDPCQVEIYSGNIPNKLIAMTGDALGLHFVIQDCQQQASELLGRVKSETRIAAEPAILDAVEISIQCVTASSIEPEPILWLWENRIPLGKLTVFCGPPDTGKSTVAVDIVARGTRGKEWPDCSNQGESFDALMLVSEDDLSDTVVPRLTVAGADLDRVHFAKRTVISGQAKPIERQIALDTDLEAIEKVLIANPKIKLVILDPISSYLGKLKKNGEEDIRWVLTLMKELAERTKVAVVSIDHFNKNIQQAGIHRLSGAGALAAVPRAVWAFVKDAEDEEKLTRLMLNAKLNVVSEAKKAGLKYRFKAVQLPIKDKVVDLSVIDWQGKSDSNLDDVLHKQDDPEKGKQGACADWLESRLSNGPVLSREIYAEAEDKGFSKNTVRRAGARLKVASKESRDGWRMVMPKGGQSEPDAQENE
jgi:putative DNA primase/helicase